jgi:hypothetical protein
MFSFFPFMPATCLGCLLCATIASAQISDNFSDGNFSSNPTWTGNVTHFIVNSAGELQLNAPEAGTSTLAVSGNIPDTAVWNMHIRLGFAPSASNLVRIYLMSDQASLSSSNGYYLEIGENGTLDAVRLFRQDGNSVALLAAGAPGLAGTDPVDLRFRVTRTSSGLWKVSAGIDTLTLQPQFSTLDATYTGGPGRFFGFYCQYTATRVDKYFFDDISILPNVSDTLLPVLLPKDFEVLINEIMADPTPSAGLPEVEWLELYNRTDKTFQLKDLHLDDGGTAHVLPDYQLGPGGYVVVCSASSFGLLSPFIPNLVQMTGFPSLNNDADVLTLSTASGRIIDRVAYDITWHTDPMKKNGGWSLERINPDAPCLGGDNWQSCPVAPGGTPGTVNASLQAAPDLDPPQLVSVFPADASTLLARFSEGLATGLTPGAFQLDPVITVQSLEFDGPDRSEVILHLAEPLQAGVLYRFSATGAITDCSGNPVDSTTILFTGLPQIPEPSDIVVNEILFNPPTGGVRYVEFFNRSQKIFDWNDFYLANFSSGADVQPIATKRLFLPGQYEVFTLDPVRIQARYANIHPEHLVPLDLPSLDDKAGNITLYWASQGVHVTLDSFNYNQNMHNGLYNVTSRDGVALERIRADEPTNVSANWTSAASSITGQPGTPTLPNSQALNDTAVSGSNWVDIPLPRISPDGDGYEDFLEIRYHLPETGFAATVTIFDSGGIPVKKLLRQELTGTEGHLRWDGDADNGSRIRPGIYILMVELFNPSGETHREKKTINVIVKSE